jgi:hypothetical protein
MFGVLSLLSPHFTAPGRVWEWLVGGRTIGLEEPITNKYCSQKSSTFRPRVHEAHKGQSEIRNA